MEHWVRPIPIPCHITTMPNAVVIRGRSVLVELFETMQGFHYGIYEIIAENLVVHHNVPRIEFLTRVSASS